MEFKSRRVVCDKDPFSRLWNWDLFVRSFVEWGGWGVFWQKKVKKKNPKTKFRVLTLRPYHVEQSFCLFCTTKLKRRPPPSKSPKKFRSIGHRWTRRFNWFFIFSFVSMSFLFLPSFTSLLKMIVPSYSFSIYFTNSL